MFLDFFSKAHTSKKTYVKLITKSQIVFSCMYTCGWIQAVKYSDIACLLIIRQLNLATKLENNLKYKFRNELKKLA